MAGSSRKSFDKLRTKEGLGCECGKLLLEKDPEMGLGVRCGRRECDKFHPLEEINQRAAEFGEQKEKREEEMKETKVRVEKLFEEIEKLAREADPVGFSRDNRACYSVEIKREPPWLDYRATIAIRVSSPELEKFKNSGISAIGEGLDYGYALRDAFGKLLVIVEMERRKL